jgi:hypothetical protein
VIDVSTLNADASVWRSMLLAACAAGISALMNFFIGIMDENKLY